MIYIWCQHLIGNLPWAWHLHWDLIDTREGSPVTVTSNTRRYTDEIQGDRERERETERREEEGDEGCNSHQNGEWVPGKGKNLGEGGDRGLTCLRREVEYQRLPQLREGSFLPTQRASNTLKVHWNTVRLCVQYFTIDNFFSCIKFNLNKIRNKNRHSIRLDKTLINLKSHQDVSMPH